MVLKTYSSYALLKQGQHAVQEPCDGQPEREFTDCGMEISNQTYDFRKGLKGSVALEFPSDEKVASTLARFVNGDYNDDTPLTNGSIGGEYPGASFESTLESVLSSLDSAGDFDIFKLSNPQTFEQPAELTGFELESVFTSSDFDQDRNTRVSPCLLTNPGVVFKSSEYFSVKNGKPSFTVSQLRSIMLKRLDVNSIGDGMNCARLLDEILQGGEVLDISNCDLPSIGSVLHDDGFCKPCVFANKNTKVCHNGVQCKFCHFPHKDRKRRNKRESSLGLGSKSLFELGALPLEGCFDSSISVEQYRSQPVCFESWDQVKSFASIGSGTPQWKCSGCSTYPECGKYSRESPECVSYPECNSYPERISYTTEYQNEKLEENDKGSCHIIGNFQHLNCQNVKNINDQGNQCTNYNQNSEYGQELVPQSKFTGNIIPGDCHNLHSNFIQDFVFDASLMMLVLNERLKDFVTDPLFPLPPKRSNNIRPFNVAVGSERECTILPECNSGRTSGIESLESESVVKALHISRFQVPGSRNCTSGDSSLMLLDCIS